MSDKLKLVEDAKRLVARYPTRFKLTEIKNEHTEEHSYMLESLSGLKDRAWLFLSSSSWRTEHEHPVGSFAVFLARNMASNAADDKWRHRFLRLAKMVSSYSKDPSTKVGAVIVDDDDNVRTIGYNGFPRGVNDTPERLADRSIKYPFTVHAELNAICTCARVGVPTKGATMVCTHFPCAPCAGAITQAGFKEVLVLDSTADFASRWNGSNDEAKTIFTEGGVDVTVVFEDELAE